MHRTFCFAVALLLFVGCGVTIPAFDAGTPCAAEAFTVLDNFGGARRGRCAVLAPNHVRLSILPEDDGYINPSPWYAFRLQPSAGGTALVTLKYFGGKHRYVPKLSYDGLTWSPLDETAVEVSGNATIARIEVPLDDRPVFIAAQELVTPAIYRAWNRLRVDRGNAELQLLGRSLRDQPIHMLVSNPTTSDVLFLVGRQHPPEISGALAFFSFTETLLADTELARRFRSRFQVVAIPLLNPDGVLGGNWRHNLGGTDLNRDWGSFTQPETKLVGQLLDTLDANGQRIRVFVDFHSTRRNVLYIPEKDAASESPGFFRRWIARAAPRLDNYPVTGEPSGTKSPGIAKNYIYQRYGIPAATYEVGDETDRRAVREAAVVFAEELMELMLETLPPTG